MESEAQHWLPIIGHPGYEVSSLGRVRSIGRDVKTSSGIRRFRGRLRKPVGNNRGYLMMRLTQPGKPMATPLVHRLVAIAFLGSPSAGMTVNHKNGRKTDNRVSNLEWTTNAENRDHARFVLNRRFGRPAISQ